MESAKHRFLYCYVILKRVLIKSIWVFWPRFVEIPVANTDGSEYDNE